MQIFIYVIYILAFFAALYFVVRKRRHHPILKEPGFEIDQSVLGAAEQIVNGVDIRQELSKVYDFFDSYSTLQGYSEDYMIQLVNTLKNDNITADFIFVESGPPGLTSYTQRQGTFELYVQKGMIDSAAESIRKA